MTYAPDSIKGVRAYLKGEDPDLDDVELGIVGGPSHIRQGTSYHLGADQLIMSKNPYSARTSRDRAGMSNAASALDIDDDLDRLPELSVWLVAECRKNTADTRDIREIIYSPDGNLVFRWDRERGVSSAPVPDSDLSHRTHTHVSWYRDSEFRDKTGPFRRFFEGDSMADIAVDVNYMAWRIEALTHGFDAMRDGPEKGKANWAVKALKQLQADVAELKARPAVQPAPVDPAALKAALLDPEVLAAIAEAVADEDHRRSAAG